MDSSWMYLLHWRQIAHMSPTWVAKVTDIDFHWPKFEKIFLAQSIGSIRKRGDLEYEVLTPSSFWDISFWSFVFFTNKTRGTSRLGEKTGKTSIFGIFLIRRTGFCVSWVTKLIGNVIGGVCVHMVKIWKFENSKFQK